MTTKFIVKDGNRDAITKVFTKPATAAEMIEKEVNLSDLIIEFNNVKQRIIVLNTELKCVTTKRDELDAEISEIKEIFVAEDAKIKENE